VTTEQLKERYNKLRVQSNLLLKAEQKFENLLNRKGVIYHHNKGFLRSLMVGDSLDSIMNIYSVYLKPARLGDHHQPIQLYIFLSAQDSLSQTPICPAGYMKAYVGEVIRSTVPNIDRKSLYVSYSSREEKYLVKPLGFLRSYSKSYKERTKGVEGYIKPGPIWMRLDPKKSKENILTINTRREPESFPYKLGYVFDLVIGKDFLIDEKEFLKLFSYTNYDNFWKLKMKVKLKEMETLFGGDINV
jgi:hypothetical protein